MNNYGGFWIRFLAYLVDSVIVFMLIIVVGGALAFLGEAGALLIPAACLAIPVLYWALMQSSPRQASVGKALLGLKVTDASGGRLALPRSLAREVCKYISAAPLMIGFLLAGFTKRKQALHDFFVASTVVREGRSHTLVALVVGTLGWIAPMGLVMVLGVGMFAGMMGYMGGDMLAAVQEAQKQTQQQVPAPMPKKAAAAPAAPAAPVASAALAAPAAPAAEVQTLLAARLSGIDKPGSARAGPAIVELDSLSGGSFAIKTYLPMYKEFDGNGVSVQLAKVVDAKGADLYDPAHSLESAFFQRVSLRGESAPVPHLGGARRVNLKSGADGKNLERAEGSVKLSIPVKPVGAIFEGGDLGKQQTVHGVGITLKTTKGSAYTFEYKGDQSRIVSTSGIGTDGKRVNISSSGGGGGLMTYTFAAPVARIEVVVAESLSQHSFPFTLTRTSLAGPAGPPPPVALKTADNPVASAPAQPVKAEAPKKPVALPVAAKPKPVVLVQAPKPEPMKEVAKPDPTPTPVRVAPAAAPGPSTPGPKFNDLMTAVLYRDAGAVNQLLAYGKWPDKRDSRGVTPLMAAVAIGERAIAEALLKAGANPGQPGPGGETALSIARERNDAAMLELLRK
jgi:uncharacterized RDD family membrane protein YckC